MWPHIDLKNKYTILHNDNGEKNYCDHIINTISIRANGDVVACCYDLTSKLVTGNIYENSIKNIWDGQKYSILRSQIENNTPPKSCSKCSVISQITIFKKLNKFIKSQVFDNDILLKW